MYAELPGSAFPAEAPPRRPAPLQGALPPPAPTRSRTIGTLRWVLPRACLTAWAYTLPGVPQACCVLWRRLPVKCRCLACMHTIVHGHLPSTHDAHDRLPSLPINPRLCTPLSQVTLLLEDSEYSRAMWPHKFKVAYSVALHGARVRRSLACGCVALGRPGHRLQLAKPVVHRLPSWIPVPALLCFPLGAGRADACAVLLVTPPHCRRAAAC